MAKKFTKPGSYPQLWVRGLIQANVRKRANHRCEQCGMEFIEGTNNAKYDLRSNGYPIIGTVHHIDFNKSNCSMNNLVYLCQSCHYTVHLYDWSPGQEIPLRWLWDMPRWIDERQLPYLIPKQMKLWEEI